MAGFGELIKLCLAIVFRSAPAGADEAFLLKLEQRGIERAVVQLQQVAAGLLDTPRQPIAVLRTHGFKRAQDHKTESSLPNVRFVAHGSVPFVLLLPTNRSTLLQLLWECNTKVSGDWFRWIFGALGMW